MGMLDSQGTMDGMIFKPAARYPADPRAVFILALSVFSGATALALRAAPGSLESALPRWGVVLWGVILVVGSATTLFGMLFQTVSGIITEQVGSVMVGSATLFYSGLAVWILGNDAINNVGIIAGWGFACFVRWVQLQSLLRETYRRVQAEQFHQAVQEGVERVVREHGHTED